MPGLDILEVDKQRQQSTMALDAKGLEAKFKKIAGDYEVKGGAAGAYFSMSDVKRELGIVQADHQYANRLMALTDPAKYYAERKRAFDGMTDEIELAYQKSFAEYAEAGLSNEDSKAQALKSAAAIRDQKMKIIELNFPSGANAVGASSLARTVGSRVFSGSLGGSKPAPRRRAPARRKRQTRR